MPAPTMSKAQQYHIREYYESLKNYYSEITTKFDALEDNDSDQYAELEEEIVCINEILLELEFLLTDDFIPKTKFAHEP